jgi:hypothetical protein
VSTEAILVNSINDLYTRLKGDRLRTNSPFNDDLKEANELLHNSSAFPDEWTECLRKWCQLKQPCQFGKIAAKEGRIHFCVLSDGAVAHWTDEEISSYIATDQKLWKQRAAFDIAKATHSFVLVVASSKVALAAPDEHLREFSNAILKLSGWSVGRHRLARPVNEVSSGYLYLRNPTDKQLYGFQFNIDFFACAGHSRWWHDHRFPGGIAFTANSLGHMRAYRNWYGKGSDTEWATLQAMLTIDNAEKGKVATKDRAKQPDPEGRSTWLKPLSPEGMPQVPGLTSPLAKTPDRLQSKDWTKYEGYLHTDHAVREEFFQDRDIPPNIDRPYVMDFTYIFDESQPDFAEFSGGRRFTETEVYSEIGRPEDWEHRGNATPRSRTDEEAAIVAQQLAVCRNWEPTLSEDSLDG